MSESSSSGDLDHSKTQRAKFFQRWPRLGELYVYLEKDGVDIDYAKETKAKEELENFIEEKLKVVWDKHEIKKSFRESFNEILSEKVSKAERKDPNTRLPFLILDELMSYFLDDKGKPSMEVKYYTQRAFQELRKNQLSGFYDGPPRKTTGRCKDDMIQSLEEEMTFLSEFFYQEQFAMDYFVSSELDYLADKVMDLLREKNPSHPLLSVSKDKLKEWQSIGFTVNKFDDAATREILDCQCELFKKLGFAINKRTKKDLIDIYEVLESKKGNWQVIFTIFMGVAHRLGVYCRLLRQQGNKNPNLGWKSQNSQETKDKSGKRSNKNYFALNIFECTESQHKVVSCSEDYIEEVFGCTVAFDIIPSVVVGELRADLLEILDNDNMVSHKYQLSDSSEEDERYGGNNDYSSDDSGDSDSGNDYDRRRKKKRDSISIDTTKFLGKLSSIRKRMQAFEARKQLRNQEQEIKRLKDEMKILKSQK